jgi:hypothetical protein
VKVRIFHSHSRYFIEGNLEISGIRNLAVFVVYPGTTPIDSVQRIVEELKSQNYQVLIVINRNDLAENWKVGLMKLNCAIMVRTNIGSDFGAYKAGIQYLIKEGVFELLSNLVLVNDSTYVTDDSKRIISDLVKPDSEVNCIFLHRQSVPHAAATLLRFDSQILRKKQFVEFWQKYFPYILKSQIIRKGEHALTEVCTLSYFRPWVNLSNLFKDQMPPQMLPCEIMQMRNWARRSLGSGYQEFHDFVNEMPLLKVLEYCIFNFQISNSIGLYLARNFAVPLKLDLVKLGLVVKSDYEELLNEKFVNLKETKEILNIIERKGAYLTRSYADRLQISN